MGIGGTSCSINSSVFTNISKMHEINSCEPHPIKKPPAPTDQRVWRLRRRNLIRFCIVHSAFSHSLNLDTLTPLQFRSNCDLPNLTRFDNGILSACGMNLSRKVIA